jgi:hypothetical protein
MTALFINIAYFIGAILLAFVSIWLFGSIFISFFNTKHNYKDDLPLNMIYKNED